MKKELNKKIRRMLTVAICVLFVATCFSGAAIDSSKLSKETMVETTDQIDEMGIRDYIPEFKIVKDTDWNYWSNPPHMYSIPEGNVGIGTTNPEHALQVAGNVEADGFTIDGVPVGTSTDSYWSESGVHIHYDIGNVGIGDVPPSNSKLYVKNNAGVWRYSIYAEKRYLFT